MSTFLMKPKIDFAFKEIMADEQARIGFLAAVLHLNPEDIKETRILNSYLRKVHEDDKLGILDVRVLMNNDTEIDTEIQLAERKEEFDMIAEKKPYIDSAYRQLQVISQDKQKRMEYEAREKAVRDHNQIIYEAEQRGEKRGEVLGAQRVNKLNSRLIQEKRFADLERSARDEDFQKQLMKEYGI